MIRIGFIINFHKNSWLGGYNYFANLFRFLMKHPERKIEPVIITDDKKQIVKEKEFKDIQVIESNIVSRPTSFRKKLTKLVFMILGKEPYLDKFLIENKIDALSHSGTVGRFSKIKSFPWIPDFQEINLPENFSFTTRLVRRLSHYNNIINSTKIIVSSNAVKDDFKKISLAGYKKSEVIKHVNYVVSKNKIKSRKYLKKKYNITKKFFLLPNHYWIHKNHIVVLKALHYLKKKDFIVVSTGRCHDHRYPEYFKNFKKKIYKLKLQNHFKIIGIVPFEDLCCLIHNSLGVINPSFSEGFPNSADQASLLGRIAILSKLKVNLEEKRKNYFFFDPENYKQLAKILYKKAQISKYLKKGIKKNEYFERKYINKYQNFILKNIKK